MRRNGRGEAVASLGQRLLQALGRWKGRERGMAKRLEVVETLDTHGRGFLVLVRCAGREYLAGGGANTVQTILPLPSTAATSGKICGEAL